jgi:hypothetical protein
VKETEAIMPKMTLAQRVAALEKKVAALEAAVADRGWEKDWRQTIGMFAGGEVMKRIDEEALAYRERDREKARRRFAKAEQKKTAKMKKL